ncbi:MAG: hypothetical protein ACRYF2_04915 [Janthinobacterium lividum]
MLCEGLALLLIERGILPKAQIVETIQGIIDVKQEIAGVTESVVVGVISIGLLQTIARSISAAPAPVAYLPV